MQLKRSIATGVHVLVINVISANTAVIPDNLNSLMPLVVPTPISTSSIWL
ncbi:hypothetical protein XBJ2_1860041 [Xenorhabdus bovienii str. Jollieti]|uniref:Uncharacterized protein n=1 Tax=Xenorhabdus bovienii (strain SS-2004) TaxID=406818 RepID=D3V526_XENBS|nr:hypothetical protein XBJ1_3637 [Xenorhabdus bovienii SS-2004]CDH28538.1 hypothetical protein XBJ2_1860041 [Xenorhabdus bovienii str. Jollieti]